MKKFYNIKMGNGDVFFINQETHTALKHVLMKSPRDRKEFFDIDDNVTIKVGQIVSVTLDKD